MENYTQNQSNVSKIIYLIISIVILCVILYFGISYYNYSTIYHTLCDCNICEHKEI